MPVIIYNSLTNKKEELVPISPPEVKMYVCGVTVYDRCHIGHARGAFIFDMVRNYLNHKGYKVTYVRNITDVDDKIIDKAANLVKEYEKKGIKKSLNEAVGEITKQYIKEYYKDMNLLGINRADVEPKATEHIDDMIKMIKVLIEKGYAYEIDGDVYFDITKYKEYGRLSNQSIEELQEGVRKEADKKKKNPLDFALWKRVKENEPYWPSPFSKGRPGWHLECSVMSIKYIGEYFDIHGGGRDLIFPHHENEIAQSQCYTGKPFANIWMHNGLLTIEGQKMAKSLGNFITIKDVLTRYTPEVLKLFFLSSHYASPIDFSDKKMQENKTALDKFYIFFGKVQRLQNNKNKAQEKKYPKKIISGESQYAKALEQLRESFTAAMDDDFNTPSALASLYEILNLGNRLISDEAIDNVQKMPVLKSLELSLKELGGILGLFKPAAYKEDEGEDMEALNKVMQILIEIRNEARSKKNYKLADRIREALDKAGILIEDEKDTTIWRKK
jgi:cysteinyl-tRNA synthetase